MIGIENAISRDDHIITAYRDHVHFMGRGGTAHEVFAELLGKKTGNKLRLYLVTKCAEKSFRMFFRKRGLHAFL